MSPSAGLQQYKMNKLSWKNEYIIYVHLSEWGSEPMMVVMNRTTDGKFIQDPSKCKLTIY